MKSSSGRLMDTVAGEREEQPIPSIIELDKKAGVVKRKSEKEQGSFCDSMKSFIHGIEFDADKICSDIYDEQVEAGLVGESMSDDDSDPYRYGLTRV